MKHLPLAAATLTLLFLPTMSMAQVTGGASVVDGDTFEIGGQRIRLWGVDAPESRQTCQDAQGRNYRCGQRAALAISDWIGARPLSCTTIDRDRYGRDVSKCAVSGQDVGEHLVRAGWAVDYQQYSRGTYAASERDARTARRGIWAGRFEEPAAWRRSDRAASAPAGPARAAAPQKAGCSIKGNINAKGERIYHSPGMRSYTDTRISTAIGERWFCSETEAQAAGWRAPRG